MHDQENFHEGYLIGAGVSPGHQQGHQGLSEGYPMGLSVSSSHGEERQGYDSGSFIGPGVSPNRLEQLSNSTACYLMGTRSPSERPGK